jgi:hypothetical protein
VPPADAQTQRRGDYLERGHDRAEVQQRLAHAHEHDIRAFGGGILLDEAHLIRYLVRVKVAPETKQGRGAELAAQRAPHLR